MKNLKTIIGFLVILIPLAAPLGQAGERITLEDLTFCVAYLNHDSFSGTGVFVVIKDHPYLITASHVANKLGASSLVVIKGENDNPIHIHLSDVARDALKPEWITHDHADIAVLPISPKTTALRQVLKGHFLSGDVFVKQLTARSRKIPLTILGFPFSLGVRGKFSPLSKNSLPASGLLTLKRGDTNTETTFILLEDPSVGGFSGGPVFDLPGTKMHPDGILIQRSLACVGIVHGTLSDKTGGKFAAITPGFFILETIEKAERIGKKTAQEQ